MALQLLVVCTANICRSVMAQALLRAGATDRRLDLEVDSAGFLTSGSPPSAAVIEVMAERGLDVSAHRSRMVDEVAVGEADLVVTMERRHGRDLIASHDVDPDRVHTLGALVPALAFRRSLGSPGERIAAVAADRSPGALLGHGDDEIPDPHGGPLRAHRRTADRLATLTDGLLDGLFDGPAA